MISTRRGYTPLDRDYLIGLHAERLKQQARIDRLTGVVRVPFVRPRGVIGEACWSNTRSTTMDLKERGG